MMCDVISRDRPGTGPAAVPSKISFVPLASLRAACACCAAAVHAGACAEAGRVAAPINGAVAIWLRKLRLESPNFDMTGTDCLPERPIWRTAKMVLHFAALAHRFAMSG